MSCPICQQQTLSKYRPFCSKRCADLDLAKWLNGSYALPSQREEVIEDEPIEANDNAHRPH